MDAFLAIATFFVIGTFVMRCLIVLVNNYKYDYDTKCIDFYYRMCDEQTRKDIRSRLFKYFKSGASVRSFLINLLISLVAFTIIAFIIAAPAGATLRILAESEDLSWCFDLRLLGFLLGDLVTFFINALCQEVAVEQEKRDPLAQLANKRCIARNANKANNNPPVQAVQQNTPDFLTPPVAQTALEVQGDEMLSIESKKVDLRKHKVDINKRGIKYSDQNYMLEPFVNFDEAHSSGVSHSEKIEKGISIHLPDKKPQPEYEYLNNRLHQAIENDKRNEISQL